MNFFQHQDQAKKKTSQLVFLMFAAVITLILVATLLLAVVFYFFQNHTDSITAANAYQTDIGSHLLRLLTSELTLWVALGVVTVVVIGSLFKSLQLRAGGKAIAESLGGKLINPDTSDKDEKRLLNVIEEMAIASGNPVPSVYLLEEPGINAFAAGQTRRDAVIGVTRGCIRQLNRDELQGVIAHEFSHIHNGDMKLNMRLIAILHGILVIGLIGSFILRGSAFRSHGRNNDKGAAQQAILGLALVVIGYSGTFFGNIIKAAVSRQREFLADASAVQFTRNPKGISGALKKIGGISQGSTIQASAAAEFSHMYFGQGVKTAFSGLMATHPPLDIRIRRIEPNWDGNIAPQTESPAFSGQEAVAGFSSSTSQQTASLEPEQAIETIGAPQTKHFEHADRFLKQLSTDIRQAAHNAFSARALIYCLLLDADKRIRQQQLTQLKDGAHPATFREMPKLYKALQEVERQHYLSVLDLSIPALKQQSKPQYEVFKKNLIALIKADKSVSLFEWCLFRIITQTLEETPTKSGESLKSLGKEVSTLLSLIVLAGQNSAPTAAFNAGADILNNHTGKLNYSNKGLSFPEIDKALHKLSAIKPLEKPALLKAIGHTIAFDKKVTSEETELFRAIADTLDCPIPPLVSG